MKRTLAYLTVLLCALAVSAQGESLKVVTYNVGLLKVFGSNYVPQVDARAAAAPAVIARFASESSPDIILLEEVWRDAYAKDIENALAPLGYSFVYPDVHTMVGLTSGLLLAVKAPLRIVDWKFTSFTRATLIGSFARKGVLEATMETGGGLRFAFVGTHTEPIDTNNGVPKDAGQVAVFASQAAQIRASLETRSGSGALPAIMLGDFNVGPGYADGSYHAVADAPGLRDVAVVLSPAALPATWDPQNPLVKYGEYPNEPPANIDHVFIRDGSSLQWKAVSDRLVFDAVVDGLAVAPVKGAAPVPTPLSDHYGFEAEVELTSKS
jgi:endonuclease/exonuclease/phosphatase family metal-dependent hydrolase